MQPGQDDSHNKETFNIGAVAVVNADTPSASPSSQKSVDTETPKASKIGAFVIAKADEKLLEPGEHLVTVVRRHPIGIIAIYAEMLTGAAAVIAIVILAIYSFFASVSGSTKGLIAAGAVFVVAFLIFILLVATYVYRRCRLVVTDKSVVQILQKALFSRKISRLSMSNVEDVNVEQKGILPTMLNFGTLTIQTAGQEDNFVFPLCPEPDKYANQILEARQQFVKAYGEDGQ